MTLTVARGTGGEYQRISNANVADIPHKSGLLLPGETRPVRPYSVMVAAGGLAMVRAMASGREQIDMPLVAIPGLKYKGEVMHRRLGGQPVVAFNYYKADDQGAVEQQARLVAVEGFGYGVHPDNAGEEPTWYLYGDYIGSRTFNADGTIASRRLFNPPVEQIDFSMARIVGGPLGDPLTDAAQRAQMGVAEIPAAPVASE
jgi:hypothetical protein